jgi:hypothetical protein
MKRPENLLPALRELMESTPDLKEKVVLKYAVSLLEILRREKQRSRWTHEEYRRLPDSLQMDGTTATFPSRDKLMINP